MIHQTCVPGRYTEGRTTNSRATFLSDGQHWLTFRFQAFKQKHISFGKDRDKRDTYNNHSLKATEENKENPKEKPKLNLHFNWA